MKKTKIQRTLEFLTGVRKSNTILEQLYEEGFRDTNQTTPISNYKILKLKRYTLLYNTKEDRIMTWREDR